MIKRSVKYLLLTSVILMLLTACTQNTNDSDVSNDIKEENYVPVEIESIKTDTLLEKATVNGQIYPSKDVMILPKTPGKVSRINVEIGDKVSKDQILFVLDDEDIQKQVKQANAALNAANKSYEITSEQIKNAQINFERTKELYEKGAIPKSQYEQAELAASEKALEAAQAQVNQAQISYDQLKEALDNTIIKAPIDGIVSSMNIDEGEFASNAQPAMNLIDVDQLYVQINVTENIVSKIKEGQEVSISIDSLSKQIKGKIDKIHPASDPRTKLYPVKININNEEQEIMAGMFVKVVLQTNIRENVLVVKGDSVVEKNGKSYVYIVEDDNAVQKDVITGLDVGSYIEIKEGLRENEKVIIKGQNYVEDGTKVKVVRGDK